MRQTVSSSFRLGILGGGQLGKMMCQVTNSWDVKTHILDPDPEASAANVCTKFVNGSFRDYQTVMDFAKDVDLLTIEIEGVNIEAVEELAAAGLPVYPEPAVLRIIRDKGLQKSFYRDNQLPTATFSLFTNAKEIRQALEDKQLKLPFVQKLRLEGYDGHGVLIVKEDADLEKLFDAPSLVEDFIEDALEIAVIVSRNQQGEMAVYDAVEMVFNPHANLVEFLLAPARIPDDLAEKAKQIAIETAQKLKITGLLAVELFITKEGELLINEVAPRPHNSGHHTIENAITSQYEQHLRAIFGYHPGATDCLMPAVMANILGDEGYNGPVIYRGLNEVLSIPGVSIHIYGKKLTRPYRKMGHVTILDKEPEKALIKAKQVLNTLKAQA